RLAEAFDPATYRPTLASDVEIKEFHLRWGGDYAMIANPRDLLHYRLEAGELETVRLMDGTRTLKEIVVERFQESGELEMEGVADLVRSLQDGGFLEPPFVDTYAAVDRAMNPSVTRAKLREFARTLSVDWSNADRVVRWLYHHGFRAFFNRWVALLGLTVGIAGFVAFLDVTASGAFSLSGRSLAIEFLILGLLNYFITFTHELGHALGVIHYGRRIKSAGFMIYYGSPAWFIEASDTLMLDPGKRIVQSFAGPVAEIMVAGAASLVMWAFPEALISSTLYKFAVLNYFIIFMNLVPLLELDGYYILSDAIHVPDLRPRSLSFIRYDLWHKLRVREQFSAQEVGLAVYGILGVAFAAFSIYASFFFWRHLFGNLILRMWNGGWSTRLLLILLAVIIAGPLLRGLTALGRSGWRRARAAWRRLRFRLEQGWRVEAAELIDALPLFDDLPVEVLNDLAGRVRLVTVARGQPVVRQGERPESFFVVRRGALQAVEEDPDTGNERVLRVLGRGESFGELGLLEVQPRAATVRALEEAELFEIDKGTFDQLLSDMATVPDFAPTLQRVEELRALPPFQHLEPAQLSELLDHGEWVNLGPNETFITEGEAGDAFYVIGSGQIEVSRDGQRRDVLGPGAHVGEIALLLDVPRTATVRTITPVRAYRLDREGFDRVLGEAFRTGTLNPQAPVGRTGLH
ncbi:MAG TPA: cyclic nucleotide-binding domain-containing protein, partial [Actinomycetota bacterium]|nr:cyclic nucleotide-binding domain-containing protein [Actinomycetota bacterium]